MHLPLKAIELIDVFGVFTFLPTIVPTKIVAQREEMTEIFSASEQVEGVPPGGTLAIAISGIHGVCPKISAENFTGWLAQ
jgi:hypothetical protein